MDTTVVVKTAVPDGDRYLFTGEIVGGPDDGKPVSFHIPASVGGGAVYAAVLGRTGPVHVQLPRP